MAEITLIAPPSPVLGRTLKHTDSLCPACQTQIPAAYIATDDGRAWFERTCPTHGRFATDLGPHAAFYTHIFELDEKSSVAGPQSKRRCHSKPTRFPCAIAPIW